MSDVTVNVVNETDAEDMETSPNPSKFVEDASS